MNPKDMVKTAFVCPWGKYEYRRMPFGLWNAPTVFQLLMEKVLADHCEYARTYIDDIIVFSKDWESHLHHIRKVLSALSSAGLTANPTNCEWGGRQMLYLGHMVGSGKLSVPRDRAEAMANFQWPVTKRGLRSFLGSVSYYRRFIPRIAERPLHCCVIRCVMCVSFMFLHRRLSLCYIPMPRCWDLVVYLILLTRSNIVF